MGGSDAGGNMNLEPESQFPFPWWVWIVIGVAGCLCLLACCLSIYLLTRDDDDDDLDEWGVEMASPSGYYDNEFESARIDDGDDDINASFARQRRIESGVYSADDYKAGGSVNSASGLPPAPSAGGSIQGLPEGI